MSEKQLELLITRIFYKYIRFSKITSFQIKNFKQNDDNFYNPILISIYFDILYLGEELRYGYEYYFDKNLTDEDVTAFFEYVFKELKKSLPCMVDRTGNRTMIGLERYE